MILLIIASFAYNASQKKLLGCSFGLCVACLTVFQFCLDLPSIGSVELQLFRGFIGRGIYRPCEVQVIGTCRGGSAKESVIMSLSKGAISYTGRQPHAAVNGNHWGNEDCPPRRFATFNSST